MPIQRTIKYKFLRQPDRRKAIKSENRNLEWKLGKWNAVAGPVQTCGNGLHCSDNILQALGSTQGEVLAVVEVRGEHEIEHDKSAWREMRMVHAYRWTKEDSIAFAIYAAEQVVKIYEAKYPSDTRPRDAIKAAKAYLSSQNKKTALATATAASDATYAAAEAHAAAHAATHPDATTYAAFATAYAAAAAADAGTYADATYAAAEAHAAAHAATQADAEMQVKLERWLKRRIKQLQEIKKRSTSQQT